MQSMYLCIYVFKFFLNKIYFFIIYFIINKMIKSNFFEEISKIKYANKQIIFNTYVILNELDFYEDRYYSGLFDDSIKNINYENIENINYYYYQNYKYYRKDSILYMQIDNNIYWKIDNLYYKKNLLSNKSEIDNDKIFISLNKKIFFSNNIIIILNGIANLLNYLITFKTFIKHDKYNLFFINNKKLIVKVINLSKLFYFDDSKFNVKDLYEFFMNDVLIIQKFGYYLKYIETELSSVNFNISI